jgi:hypothetical protein
MYQVGSGGENSFGNVRWGKNIAAYTYSLEIIRLDPNDDE